jgi:hypothetical protein
LPAKSSFGWKDDESGYESAQQTRWSTIGASAQGPPLFSRELVGWSGSEVAMFDVEIYGFDRIIPLFLRASVCHCGSFSIGL